MPVEKTELIYKPGERALSTNPSSGETAMFEWDGKCWNRFPYGQLVTQPIYSPIAAVMAARQVIENGGLIQPCEQVEDKRVIRCRYMDPTGLRHCTHEDGVLPKPGGGVECPLQRGDLKWIRIVNGGTNGKLPAHTQILDKRLEAMLK
ncbi:hypothetical protein HY386_00570 [Candidatus Daviesbacteria bacterium]|nr:hypothetical protein [Candidatus Daviesbacteria bacterium]